MPVRELTLGFDDTKKVAPSPTPRKPQASSSNTTRARNKGPTMQTFAPDNDGSDDDDDEDEEDDEEGAEQRVKPKKEPKVVISGGRKKRPFSMVEEELTHPVESVGLDFGMTYSAISTVPTNGSVRDVRVITEWPGTFENRDKAPSLLAHDTDNPETDFEDKSILFGYEVEPGMMARGYLKKLLSADDAVSKYDDPILTNAAGQLLMRTPASRITREDLVVYLKCMFDVYLQRSRRETIESVLERVRRHFTITHPTACTEEAKAKFVAAVKAAGIGTRKQDKISTMSEAEAAILGAFAYSSQKGEQSFFAPNTNVIVLDMGGLTQDSATVLVKKSATGLKLQQVCISQGGKCGAVSVFCRLYELCTGWFGEAFMSRPKRETGLGSQFLRDFEEQMRRFTVKDTTRPIRLELYMDRADDQHYDGGEVILTGVEMARMLDMMLEYSYDILKEQFTEAKLANNRPIMTVVLSGGVSLSRYVEDKIRKFCQEKLSQRLSVIRPDHAWSLVVRGAAIHGLQTQCIESRVARAALGVTGHRRYEPTEDDGPDHVCPIYGERVKGAMAWHVKKGEKIMPDTKKPVKAYIVLDAADIKNLDRVKGEVPLYSYAGDRKPPPECIDDEGVHRIGQIPVDLSKISKHAKTKLQKMAQPRELKLTIEQNMSSEMGLMEFVIKNGKTQVGRCVLSHEHTKSALAYPET